MKKPLLLIFAVVCVLLAACGNQTNTSSSSAFAAGTRDENDVDLIVGANYYFETKDDEGNASFSYGGWLQAGDTVLILPGEVKIMKVPDSKGNPMDDMVGPARITSSETYKKDVGKDVFVSRYYIIPRQRAAVIVAADKAEVYNGLKPLNVTTKNLPRRTIVAVAPLDEKDNPLKRQQFTAYNVPQPDGQTFKAGSWAAFYLDPADVSLSKSDIEVAKVIRGMEKIDKSKWGTAIEAAEKLYGDSILLNDAKEMIGQAGGLASRATEVKTGKATVFGDGVGVYTEPDENAGSIIGNLGYGTAVEITAQTVDAYAFGEANDHWYKIKAGDLSGWVFGGSLSIE